jgi:GNAT superfamily N-acetyltransferase
MAMAMAMAMAMTDSEFELRHSLDESQIADLLTLYRDEWWTRDRDRQSVERMLAPGIEAQPARIFALVTSASGRLVGFARVLTDGAYVGLILDVIVSRDHRGRHLGQRLLEAIVSDPALSSVQSLELVCQPELIPFYRQFGFSDLVGGSTLMRRTTAPALTRQPQAGA